MKTKKHEKITENYSEIKKQHLEKLANQILKNDEKLCKLKQYHINPNVLNLF